ncbi:MAG: riboflavin biosynthesis protein RibF [Opitutales bacterium]
MTPSSILVSLRDLESSDEPTHLAIGMFDGVHLGHARVVASSVEAAGGSGGSSVVLTFAGHPSQLLQPENPTPLIMASETKAARLLELGADRVVLQVFDEAFSKIEADDFVAHLQAVVPSLSTIQVGQNFRFGRGRLGDVKLLADTSASIGIELSVSEPVEDGGERISSSRIRSALAKGRISRVNEMLGHCYQASGFVERGAGRGAGLGFPTLNLSWSPGANPLHGVYAVELLADEGAGWSQGVANYGVRPTFEQGEDNPILETHLFEDPKIKPGDRIRVAFRSFIRQEQRFQSADELRLQIALDKEAARSCLAESSPLKTGI